jgi:pimeloyl-ACP methyl ester carboxylesterase
LASGGLNTPIHAKFARVVTGTNIVLSHFGALGKTLKSFFHRIAKLFYSSDYHRVSPLLQEIFTKTVKYNQHDLLSKITATTLIIRGDKDNQAPVSDAYYFHKHIIDSELVISPGGSHFAYIDYPEEVLAHISSFIKR